MRTSSFRTSPQLVRVRAASFLKVTSPRDQACLLFNQHILIKPHLGSWLGVSLLRLSIDWLSFYLGTVIFRNTYLASFNPLLLCGLEPIPKGETEVQWKERLSCSLLILFPHNQNFMDFFHL